MSLSLYDPFGSSILDPFSLFMGAPSSRGGGRGAGGGGGAGAMTTMTSSFVRPLHLDVKETDKEFEILADIPGVEHSRVNLSVHDDVVTIEVEEQHRREEGDPNTRYYRSERSSSFQSRSVRLPPSAVMEDIKADVEHGVLHILVPKKVEKKAAAGPRRIKIGGGAGGGGVISAEEKKKEEGGEKTKKAVEAE